jgi:hypothetical protein
MFLGKYAFLASMNPHIVNPALASVARDALFSMLVRAAGTRPAR